MVLKRIFEPKGDGANCIMKSLKICIFHKTLLVRSNQDDKMGRKWIIGKFLTKRVTISSTRRTLPDGLSKKQIGNCSVACSNTNLVMHYTYWTEGVCCPVVKWGWYHQKHIMWCSYWRWLVNGKCFEQLEIFRYEEFQLLSHWHIQSQTLFDELFGGSPHHGYDVHTNSVQILHQQTCRKYTKMQICSIL